MGNFIYYFVIFILGFVIGFILFWKLVLVILVVVFVIVMVGGLYVYLFIGFIFKSNEVYVEVGGIVE